MTLGHREAIALIWMEILFVSGGGFRRSWRSGHSRGQAVGGLRGPACPGRGLERPFLAGRRAALPSFSSRPPPPPHSQANFPGREVSHSFCDLQNVSGQRL